MYEPKTVVASLTNKENVICIFQCPFCKKEYKVEVPVVGFQARQAGANVKVAFPTSSKDVQEMFVSGACPHCWDNIFAEE